MSKINQALLKEYLELQYPIGKTEFFLDNEDHSNYMGFTWQLDSKGRVPVGLDTSDTDFNAIGKTGGEKTHTLTVGEMPSHTHPNNGTTGLVLMPVGNNAQGVSGVAGNGSTDWVWNKGVMPQGGGQAHNNLQPYKVFAIWVRIA